MHVSTVPALDLSHTALPKYFGAKQLYLVIGMVNLTTDVKPTRISSPNLAICLYHQYSDSQVKKIMD